MQFSPERPANFFAALAIALCLAFPASVSAIDAGDMDPHLPDKVILETMRFRAFCRKVDDKKQWQARHDKLMGMLKKELEVASTSDTRAATALRTLISDLKDAKFKPPKKGKKKTRKEYPVLPSGDIVMVNEDFHLGKEDKRRLESAFVVKSVPAMIKFGIGGGSDDSGDGGLYYKLIDPVGRVIKRGFADKDDYIWGKHLCTRSGKWRLVIEDLDTDVRDKKKAPGNRGAVEVLVKPE